MLIITTYAANGEGYTTAAGDMAEAQKRIAAALADGASGADVVDWNGHSAPHDAAGRKLPSKAYVVDSAGVWAKTA